MDEQEDQIHSSHTKCDIGPLRDIICIPFFQMNLRIDQGRGSKVLRRYD